MNFKNLVIPEKLSYEFSHFINRIVLYPVVMVTFLQFFITSKSFVTKSFKLTLFIILLGAFESIEHFAGVLIHKNWHPWWSGAFWLTALLILIGVMTFFRKILYKGGIR